MPKIDTSKLTADQKRQLRNNRIRADFAKLTNEKHLDSDYVVTNILADKYLPLSDSTIWRIVLRHGRYKNE